MIRGNALRRQHRLAPIVASIVATLTAALFAGGASAQTYPARPIRLIVAFAAGGTTDYVCRLIADKARALLGQSIVVENKPGANGAIGADYVSKAEPDEKPGSITVAITGIGAISHLTIEMLQLSAKIKLQAVPYRGAGTAIADFLGGQVNAMSAEVPVLMAQIKDGKAKILAVAAQNRSDVLPDVPTFAELGYPDVVADNWSGLLAPPKTPPAIVARLNAAFNTVVRDPDVRRRLAEAGVSTIGGTPEDLTALITRETARWRKVVAQTGVKAGN
jgi:tripartite-type tricarboxylate transporter receptor subunit TctC